MKKFPKYVGILLAVVMFVISLPFLICITLLGGDSPFYKYTHMLDDIFGL